MSAPLWAKSGIGRVIHKKRSKAVSGNYRIILLAPFLGKLYDKLLELKLGHLKQSGVMEIWEEQYGFLKDSHIILSFLSIAFVMLEGVTKRTWR